MRGFLLSCCALLLASCTTTPTTSPSSSQSDQFTPKASEWYSYGNSLSGEQGLYELDVILTTTNDGWASFHVGQNPQNPSTASVDKPPANGTIEFGQLGDDLGIAYRANAGFVGSDAFTVMVTKPNGKRFTVPTSVKVVPDKLHFALSQMPPPGKLHLGQTYLVDDGTCPPGQINEVIGGSNAQHIPRTTRCIPRPF